jgi:hypothetical protein
MPITQVLLTTALSGGVALLGSIPVADFTIEWWQKVENNSNNARPWSVGLYPTQIISLSYEGMISDYFWLNSNWIGFAAQNHIGAGWRHMAYVRNNATVKGYLNGSLYTTAYGADQPITDTSTPLYVGTGDLAAGTYKGYITDLHIIKGVAKYTENFVPQSSPITSQTGSVFLLSAVDDTLKYVDSVGGKSSTLTGTVSWNSDSPYVGSPNGSVYFDGGSYLDYGASVDWAMDVTPP